MYKVLEPIQIGPMKLKNRIMYLAMAKRLSTPEHFVTDRQIAYYANYAKRGVGLIATGACIVDEEYKPKLDKQPGMFDDKFIPGLRRLCDAVHKHGAKILLQPWHPGECPYGADQSEVKRCADWTLDEIHNIQRKFVEAMVRAKKAGADGCEFHIAHNYLPEQFLVPLFNKRTDEYGADTVEKGLRFSREIIEAARQACGDDFAITIKINAYDMGLPGGMTIDRCVEACRQLERMGVDLISVSAGGTLTDVTGMSADGHREEGWKVEYAQAVKEAVSIPVMATGSLRHPDYVEQILAEGKCDMIGMGRGLLADPSWVEKLSQGREDELRYCISCMNCFTPTDQELSCCAVNPLATRELTEIPVKKDGEGRTVVVVGSGPAGLEATIGLAERGFKPIVLEKDACIGGLERLAAKPDFKQKLGWHTEYFLRQIVRLGIEVRLNTEATVDGIKALAPYAVILATGSNAAYPRSIPGIMASRVLHVRPVLENLPEFSGKKVAIIGAGLVGLETATTFSNRGNEVIVIDLLPTPAAPPLDLQLAIRYASESGVKIYMEHKLCEITASAVIAERSADGEKIEFPVDEVVICMGSTPNNGLAEALEAEGLKVCTVGDAVSVRKIVNAVQDGYTAAMSF